MRSRRLIGCCFHFAFNLLYARVIILSYKEPVDFKKKTSRFEIGDIWGYSSSSDDKGEKDMNCSTTDWINGNGIP